MRSFLYLLLWSLWSSPFVSSSKECISLSRGKELKQYLETSHVLVVLSDKTSQDDDDDNDDEEEEGDNNTIYKELCQRLSSTPAGRVQDFEIALVTDSNMKRHVIKSSQQTLSSSSMTSWMGPFLNGYVDVAQAKLSELLVKFKAIVPKEYQDYVPTILPPPSTLSPYEPTFPEYVLYNHETGSILRYEGGEETNADAISEFVSRNLNRKKIGNFVYSLGVYDLVAAQIMTTSGYQQWLWAKVAAPLIQWLFLQPSLFSSPFSTNDFQTELVSEYVKTGLKVLEKGIEYPSIQVDRLGRMLEDSNNSISDLQKETLNQRLYTMKRFQSPITLGENDVMLFLIKLGLNLVMLISIIVLIPMVFMPPGVDDDDDDDDEGAKENALQTAEEELMNQEPNGIEEEEEINFEQDLVEVESEVQQVKPKALTKKEKRAQAIARARASMQADKERVEKVRAKKKNATAQASTTTTTSTTAYTEAGLKKMKVVELKELLRSLSLKQTGKKAELIDRILEHQG